MRRVLAVFALLATCCGLSSERAGATTSSLATLNVQLSDLPAGFQVFAEQRLTTPAAAAQADKVPVATYLKAGVLRANDRLFSGGTAATAVLVFSLVYVLKSAAAAHAFYVQFVHKVPGTSTQSSASVGDESLDVNGTTTGNGMSVRVNIAIFRRGAYMVWLGVQPVTRSFAAPRVIHLARLVDARIQHAG